jgi:hypothetical protein
MVDAVSSSAGYFTADVSPPIAKDGSPKRTPIALEDRGGRGQRSLIFFFRLSETVTMRFGMIQRRLLVLLAATMRRGGAHGYP